MNFREKISNLQFRESITKYKKFKPKPEASHLVKYKPELDYEYYICDYCGKEIIIKDKWEEKEGGICTIPSSITDKGSINLALHNKCVNCVIEVFNNIRLENKNNNHIPRID